MQRLKFEFVIIAVLIGIFLGRIPDTLALRSNAYDFFDTLVDVRSELVRNYVEEPDQSQMLEGALEGMIGTLKDPFTDYLSPEHLEQFDKQTRAQFSGIGAEIGTEGEQLQIVSPLEDSPAFEAGVMAGDIIMEIDGKSTEGMNATEAVKLITGPEGTPVSLKLRHLSGEIETLTIVRRRIEIQTVKGFSREKDHHWNFMIQPEAKVGYVRLTQFSDPSAAALLEAINQLKGQGMRGLIIDLRYNPGGLLSQAIEISDMFLSSGRIVSTKGRNSPERVENATEARDVGEFPMVVLVNEFSASAAEILSGALKDNDRAVIVGTRSFGKGSVQQVMALESGKGAIKVTTAYYYLPSGRNIHRREGADIWGVDPNDGFYVPMTFEQEREMTKIRRDSDVLRLNDGDDTGEPVTPLWLREKRADPQLAAALETMLAKLDSGQWKKVGKSNATLLTFLTEKTNLERRRELMQESIQAVSKKINELEAKIGEREGDAADAKAGEKPAEADKKFELQEKAEDAAESKIEVQKESEPANVK